MLGNLLRSFLEERACCYTQSIANPTASVYHCARLSPHLAFATLSVREIEHATLKKIHALSQDPSPAAPMMQHNLTAFLSRLAWRCHFLQKLEQQPDIEFKCMHSAFEGMREPLFHLDWVYPSIHPGITRYSPKLYS
jgi:deoxyribodipyrimidine photo-lyase